MLRSFFHFCASTLGLRQESRLQFADQVCYSDDHRRLHALFRFRGREPQPAREFCMHVPRPLVICLLIVAPAFLRMLTFEWNVVPIGALALFCGAQFRNRSLAFAIPLLSMLLGDVLLAIDTRDPQHYLFHAQMPFVYGCYAVSYTHLTLPTNREV